MATATTFSKTGVMLELSDEEAVAISAVLRLVGGHPDTTRRGLVDSIERSLRTLDICDRRDDIKGSIDFQEVKK